jgi:hypothetical protein
LNIAKPEFKLTESKSNMPWPAGRPKSDLHHQNSHHNLVEFRTSSYFVLPILFGAGWLLVSNKNRPQVHGACAMLLLAARLALAASEPSLRLQGAS